MSDHYRHVVISSIRTLFRLIHRIPDKENRTKSLIEARLTIRGRVGERDNQLVLNHQKEMASRIAFLRMITPKSSSGQTSTGTYVLRDGELIPGCGETRGSRVADGVVSVNEAVQRNNRDFKRFYGGEKPKDVFF